MVSKANKPKLKPDVRKVVGANIRRLRTDAGITQQALADQSGIYRTYLSRAEHGEANLTVTVLAALAENLKVDISVFFSE
jgi:transcriptional regulator with XRE-family HTH domain